MKLSHHFLDFMLSHHVTCAGNGTKRELGTSRFDMQNVVRCSAVLVVERCGKYVNIMVEACRYQYVSQAHEYLQYIVGSMTAYTVNKHDLCIGTIRAFGRLWLSGSNHTSQSKTYHEAILLFFNRVRSNEEDSR